MSGGEFDYWQHHCSDIADAIEELIEQDVEYADATIDKFREAIVTLRRAAAMAQRVDWLVSGDDSEADFHRRWEEEVPK